MSFFQVHTVDGGRSLYINPAQVKIVDIDTETLTKDSKVIIKFNDNFDITVMESLVYVLNRCGGWETSSFGLKGSFEVMKENVNLDKTTAGGLSR